MGYGGHGVYGVGVRERERGREARERGERETTGQERFDMHAPKHWDVKGDVIKKRG